MEKKLMYDEFIEIKEILEKEGYTDLREISGRGICGISPFIFTYGLVYNMDETGYEGRYCYPSKELAINALENWDGVGDPTDSNWIKHKGRTEYSNPNK